MLEWVLEAWDGSYWQWGFVAFFGCVCVSYGVMYALIERPELRASDVAGTIAPTGAVASLHVHPVKSCRGFDVPDAWTVGKWGLTGDREWLVAQVDSGDALHARTEPRMLMIEAEVHETTLRLTWRGPAHDLGTLPEEIVLPALDNGSPYAQGNDSGLETMQVQVWSSSMTATVVDDSHVHAWLSALLCRDVRLVCVGSHFSRPVPAKYTDGVERPGSESAFDDGLPLLLIGSASLDDLNRRLDRDGLPQVPMSRFRPNIVVKTSKAYDEDYWRRITIGDTVYSVGAACSRCVLTTIDAETGTFTGSPLKTLMRYRRPPGHTRPLFGVKLIAEERSTGIRVGDPVCVIERSSERLVLH